LIVLSELSGRFEQEIVKQQIIAARKINLFIFYFLNFQSKVSVCRVSLKLPITIALGDVVEFEILPPGTAAWLCTKDKFNLPMFSDVCQAETKAQ
jgi:hypothetical protein